MVDAAYYREYRIRRRVAGNPIPRSATSTRGDRAAQNERRQERRAALKGDPLTPLLPHLQRGSRLSWWEDELRLDLYQEWHLAWLEGRDPVIACGRYEDRERGWWASTVPLFSDQAKG